MFQASCGQGRLDSTKRARKLGPGAQDFWKTCSCKHSQYEAPDLCVLVWTHPRNYSVVSKCYLRTINHTVMAMAINYNWLFLWEKTINEVFLVLITGISGLNCIVIGVMFINLAILWGLRFVAVINFDGYFQIYIYIYILRSLCGSCVDLNLQFGILQNANWSWTFINNPSRRFPYARFAQFHHHQVHLKFISCGRH